MIERRCEGCRGLMGQGERLRPTTCADGVRRWLCEDCALEQHALVARVLVQPQQPKEGA